MSDSLRSNRMPIAAALRVIHTTREENTIVVTTMASAHEWIGFEPHPLDLIYLPSSMGQATSIGLGLALAQPERRIIVCNGDGSMLMNLGSLVTITAQRPDNLAIVLMDNGLYEVTGQQPTPAAEAIREAGRSIDYSAVARSCGFEVVFDFDDLTSWTTQAEAVLMQPGPTFVSLSVTPMDVRGASQKLAPAAERAKSFRARLA